MDIRESEFWITQDITWIDVKWFGSCERVDFADAVDAVVECFFEQSLTLVSSVLTSLVLLAFAPATLSCRTASSLGGPGSLHKEDARGKRRLLGLCDAGFRFEKLLSFIPERQ